MCLLKVKEEDEYSVPARYKRITRVSRYESPPREIRYSRAAYGDEKRSSYRTVAVLPPAPALPPPAPTMIEPPPAPPTPPAPPPAPTVAPAETVKSRRTSRAGSVAPSVAAPSRRSTTRTHLVEVEHEGSEAESRPPSSSNSTKSSGAKSKATAHSRKTSHSKAGTVVTSPASEYSIHEREQEFRRERAYSRPRNDYETYRYVNAPPEYGRSESRSGPYDPRASRENRVVIQEGRIRREYRG